jgi:rare lipoprotein A (peptidoglycan hydrolase)
VAVAAAAAGALVGSGAGAHWQRGVASVFSQYGTRLACGGRLEAGRLGVAHRTLPCGADVAFRHDGHTVTVPVIDRGPYVAGRDFDLTPAAADRLGIDGLTRLEWHR